MKHTAAHYIHTLSLHDALPIYCAGPRPRREQVIQRPHLESEEGKAEESDRRHLEDLHVLEERDGDRKSTRLNSSHTVNSYAVFCLKKKKTTYHPKSYL